MNNDNRLLDAIAKYEFDNEFMNTGLWICDTVPAGKLPTLSWLISETEF